MIVLTYRTFSWYNIAEDICQFLPNCRISLIKRDGYRLYIEDSIRDEVVLYIGGIHSEVTRNFLSSLRVNKMILWVDETSIPNKNYRLKLPYDNIVIPVSRWNKEVYEEHVDHVEDIIPRCTNITCNKCNRSIRRSDDVIYGLLPVTSGLYKRYEEILLAKEIYNTSHDKRLVLITYGIDNGIGSSDLIKLGSIDRNTIKTIYSQVNFVVSVGIEAFGMPSIESWSIGVPMLYGDVNDVRNHARGISIIPIDFDAIDMGEITIPIPLYDEYKLASLFEKVIDYNVNDSLPDIYRCEYTSKKLMEYIK